MVGVQKGPNWGDVTSEQPLRRCEEILCFAVLSCARAPTEPYYTDFETMTRLSMISAYSRVRRLSAPTWTQAQDKTLRQPRPFREAFKIAE